jgi:hypothetical protein
MWVWLLIGVAVLVILFYRSTRENLTNEEPVPERNEKPIYGPTALPPVDGTNTGGSKSGKTIGGPYPEIFGPDTAPQIGAGSIAAEEKKIEPKPKEPESKCDCKKEPKPPTKLDDGQRKLNPFLTDAFPYEGPPQPFLTDFSKILH